MQTNIIIMGIKHCGKTTLGKRLADKLGYLFMDIDHMVEALPVADGLSVPEIYRQRGQATFEEYEVRAVIGLKQEMPQKPFILAPGGGIIENLAAMSFLSEIGTKIFLHADPHDLYDRIIKKGIPAFLSEKDPYNHFLEIYKKRTKLYKEDADLTLDIQGKSPDEALEVLMEAMKGKLDGR